MAKKSIGDLHATVTANAVQFVEEFKRADNESRRSAANIKKTLGQQFGDELSKTGKKFALGFLGGAALTAVIGGLKDVARNIDDIPGVPQSTLTSIRTMNYEFAQTQSRIKQASAVAVGYFADFGTWIGNSLGRLVYGSEAADDAMAKMNAEAERFARSDFLKKLGELRAELEKGSVVSRGGMIRELQSEAAALEEFAKTGVLNLKAYTNAKLEAFNIQVRAAGGATQAVRDEAELQALRDRIDAQKTMNDLIKEQFDVLGQNNQRETDNRLAQMLPFDAEKEIQRMRSATVKQLFSARNSGDVESETDALKSLGDLDQKLYQLKNRVKSTMQEIDGIVLDTGDKMSGAFADFFEGTTSGFTDLRKVVVRQIEEILAKTLLVIPIMHAIGAALSSVGGFFGGGFGGAVASLGSSFSGYRAGGGDVSAGSSYVVGEKGPELFMPKTSGVIVPNSALSNRGGGEVYNFTYNIPAGVTHAELVPILRAQEKRTMAAVEDARRRRKAS